MIVLGILLCIVLLIFLVAVIYRGYLKDEAARQQEIENEVKQALSKMKKENE